MNPRVITDLTRCTDCGYPTAAEFGPTHNGNCQLEPIHRRLTAADIIRRHAATHDTFSANHLRSEFIRHGVKETARGPAFQAAIKTGVIRKVGHVASDETSTHGHGIGAYESLITPKSMEERRVA